MSSSELAVLKPFEHQVAGHSNIYTYGHGTLCKPLLDREFEFYKTLPDCLKKFTPECKGYIDVKFEKDENGLFSIKSSSPPRWLGPVPHTNTRGSENCHKTDPSAPEHYGGKNGTKEICSQPYWKNSNNPWVKRCHEREMEKMRTFPKLTRGRYILLENLVSDFRSPSVLDLKMGTRQHGVDESGFKLDLKIGHCLSSTTSTIGFRICGMQVHQKNSLEFIRLNKRDARALTKETMQQSLRQFLYNGVNFREDLVGPILDRLTKLYCEIASHCNFRFYSSSLIILYEGEEVEIADGGDKHGAERKVDIRMIDFAQSVKGTTFVGPDVGYLFGLKNLIRYFEDIS